ncbi:hypothetical protein [Chromobacterium paludis]|uniref:Uncharacterized protein n=1 Tax=Chromobacterium paludis TaxID=2605945 RepID=A0A5C1DFP5_9NEIS|nr:hypothetical protein [Chromobacterium paludis]QEL54408.1 hypothetical protein FYK34_01850 [Chromobacterium paludis]
MELSLQALALDQAQAGKAGNPPLDQSNKKPINYIQVAPDTGKTTTPGSILLNSQSPLILEGL